MTDSEYLREMATSAYTIRTFEHAAHAQRLRAIADKLDGARVVARPDNSITRGAGDTSGREAASEDASQRADWARGAKAPGPAATSAPPEQPDGGNLGSGGDFLTVDQVIDLETRCRDNRINPAKLIEKLEVPRLSIAPAASYQRALDWIDKVLEARKARENA